MGNKQARTLTGGHHAVRRGQLVRAPALDVAGGRPEKVPPALDQLAQAAHGAHAAVEAGPLVDFPFADYVAKVRPGRPLHCKRKEEKKMTVISAGCLPCRRKSVGLLTFEFG